MNEFAKRYPENTKLKRLDEERFVIVDFLHWLSQEGYVLCKWSDEEDLVPVHVDPVRLVHQHLNIDDNQLEFERTQMLEEIRNAI